MEGRGVGGERGREREGERLRWGGELVGGKRGGRGGKRGGGRESEREGGREVEVGGGRSWGEGKGGGVEGRGVGGERGEREGGREVGGGKRGKKREIICYYITEFGVI